MGNPLIPLLRQQIVDGTGAPYASAKLYSYIAGTTTLQDTYSDSALAVPNANPVVADLNGRFGAIYLDPAKTYKFVLKTSADVEVFSQDNVSTLGDQTLTVLAKTANYTVAVGDGEDVLILVDATAGNVTITLYTAAGNAGKKVRVMKIDSSVNTVTIDPHSTQTWNGASTRTLARQWETANGASDNSNWVEFIEASSPVDDASGILASRVFSWS